MHAFCKRIAIAVLFAFATGAAVAEEQQLSFTYQGQLQDEGVPIDGTADLVFRLRDDPVAGNQVGNSQVFNDYPVMDGLFTLDLAFPGAFNGQQLWLDVSVNGVALTPRQAVTTVPVAQFALSGTPGPMGPVGPAGPAGEPGPQGPGTVVSTSLGSVSNVEVFTVTKMANCASGDECEIIASCGNDPSVVTMAIGGGFRVDTAAAKTLTFLRYSYGFGRQWVVGARNGWTQAATYEASATCMRFTQ